MGLKNIILPGFLIQVILAFSGIIAGCFTGLTPAQANITDVTRSPAESLFPGKSDSLVTYNMNTPVGFASVSGDGFAGAVTGGGHLLGSDNIVYINGPADFEKLVILLYDRKKAYKNKADFQTARYAPLIVILSEGVYPEAGAVANTGSVWGNSMLAIEEQGDLTIVGKGNVVLKFGINVKRSYNVLIRNLSFQDYYDDGINIGEPETHHVWVDHCTFGHPSSLPADSEHPDGGCDIKDGASYVTVSWCLFRNSWKTSLVGHSDNNGATDIGRLKVTCFANYFKNTNSRHPRVRFGEVHVLNNYYENVSGYGIAAANSAQVFAEGNFFMNTRFPMYADRTKADFATAFGPLESYTGNYPATGLKQVNNRYDDTMLPVLTASFVNPKMLNPGNRSIRFDEFYPEKVFQPGGYYRYDTLDVTRLPELIPLHAGAGKTNFVTGISSVAVNSDPPDNRLVIFPNPVSADGSFSMNGKGFLAIYNSMGQLVFENPGYAQNQTIGIRQAGLKPGCYFVFTVNHSSCRSGILVIR